MIKPISATLLLLLYCITLRGQTAIQELEYKANYNFGCMAYALEMSAPLLQSTGPEDIREVVNDSILSMFKGHLAYFHQPEPRFTTEEECPKLYQGTEDHRWTYDVSVNTADMLVLTLSSSSNAGNGGHGSDSYDYLFNMDLKRNKLLTLEDLFTEKNRQNLMKYIRNDVALREVGNNSALYENQGEFFASDTIDFLRPQENTLLKYIGFKIDSSFLYLHFTEYWGHYITHTAYLTIPWEKIGAWLNKEYLWISRLHGGLPGE